jgi:hypothetical protein
MARRLDMFLTETELHRGYALRSAIRAAQFYSVGDIRKAINKVTRCSFGIKVLITDLIPWKFDKEKITFRRVKEKVFQ